MGRGRSSSIIFAVAYLSVVAGLFLALGGAAYAQSPATNQYGTKVKGVKVSATTEAETTATQAETLPNTGLSLLAVAVVGGGLVAGGLLLRRRERTRE